MSPDDKLADDARLLAQIKEALPQLKALLEEVDGHWSREDGIYRFYHQSFKVCYLQGTTLKIVAALRELWPGRELNAWFCQIVAEGTVGAPPPPDADLSGLSPQVDGRPVIGGAVLTFDHSWNADWLRHTRPIVEAFMHARFMLEMAVKYGRELDDATSSLPSGWAALLYLYDAR